MPRFASPPPTHDGVPKNKATRQMAFDAVWLDLRGKLHRGTEIRGWSREKDDTGLRFTITDFGPDAITIRPAVTSDKPKPQERRIGKSDFEGVYRLWRGYCDGEISRVEVTKVSQNTSYIFSLLRWRECA